MVGQEGVVANMSEQVSVKKRGRPKGSKNKTKGVVAEEASNNQLVELMMQQNQMMQQMLGRTIQLAEGNQQMMRDWFSLFRPPAGPNTTSSLDQREWSKYGEDEGDWEPMPSRTAEEILQLFNLEDKQYRERLINE